MILNNIRSDILLTRAAVWVVIAKLYEGSPIVVLFYAVTLWDVLRALTGVDE